MVAPHYYASTSGILVDRFLKYGLFELAYGAALALFRTNHDNATRIAQAMCAAGSAAITTGFLGLEADALDDTGRKAIAAELGIDSKDVKLSDLRHSKNTILNKAYDDLLKLQVGRYGTDLLFMSPMVAEGAYSWLNKGKEVPPSRKIQSSTDHRSSEYDLNKYTSTEKFLAGNRAFAYSPYAGKALYWLYETYEVDKTSYYEIVKLRETMESTGKDLRANDLKAVYQRCRNDRGLPMVSDVAPQEHAALNQLFTRMAAEYNKHDGKFGINEIVYLIGNNKINIHDDDNITFSQAAVEKSMQEIDHILRIGLKGIGEENRKRRAAARSSSREAGSIIEGGIIDANLSHDRVITFTDRIVNTATDSIRSILNTTGLIPKRYEERISPRDPTDIIGLGR